MYVAFVNYFVVYRTMKSCRLYRISDGGLSSCRQW